MSRSNTSVIESLKTWNERWVDRPETEASWVEKAQLENCEALVQEFQSKQSKRPRLRKPHFQTTHAMATGVHSTKGNQERPLDILILTNNRSDIIRGVHPLDRRSTPYHELDQDLNWRSTLFAAQNDNIRHADQEPRLQGDIDRLLQHTRTAKLYTITDGRIVRRGDLEKRREDFKQIERRRAHGDCWAELADDQHHDAPMYKMLRPNQQYVHGHDNMIKYLQVNETWTWCKVCILTRQEQSGDIQARTRWQDKQGCIMLQLILRKTQQLLLLLLEYGISVTTWKTTFSSTTTTISTNTTATTTTPTTTRWLLQLLVIALILQLLLLTLC